MKTVMVNLMSISAVKQFVEITSKHKCESTLRSGRHVVDAKSIMGIFSLDLSKPIELTIDNGSDCDEFIKAIDSFIVKSK